MNRCKNCDAPKGKQCPRWFDVERAVEADLYELNITTGQRRPITGCFYEIFLRYLRDTASSVRSSAAAIESCRNVTMQEMDQLRDGIVSVVDRVSSIPYNDKKLLTNE